MQVHFIDNRNIRGFNIFNRLHLDVFKNFDLNSIRIYLTRYKHMFHSKIAIFFNHIFNAASGKLYCQAFPLFVHSFNSLPLIPFGILPHNILILRPSDLE